MTRRGPDSPHPCRFGESSSVYKFTWKNVYALVTCDSRALSCSYQASWDRQVCIKFWVTLLYHWFTMREIKIFFYKLQHHHQPIWSISLVNIKNCFISFPHWHILWKKSTWKLKSLPQIPFSINCTISISVTLYTTINKIDRTYANNHIINKIIDNLILPLIKNKISKSNKLINKRVMISNNKSNNHILRIWTHLTV